MPVLSHLPSQFSLVFLSEQHTRQNIQREYIDGYQEHAGPCHLLPVGKWAQSKLEYGDRQVRHRVTQIRSKELIGQRSEQQWRSLSCYARQGEQHASHHTRTRRL